MPTLKITLSKTLTLDLDSSDDHAQAWREQLNEYLVNANDVTFAVADLDTICLAANAIVSDDATSVADEMAFVPSDFKVEITS